MKMIQLFLWLLAPVALWLAITLWGTPHLVVGYRFHDNGDRYNPLVPRVYTSCSYLGVHGTVRVPAFDADCPWIVFLRSAP